VASDSQATLAAGVDAAERSIVEPRWPPVAALILYVALNIGSRIWLPNVSAVGLPRLIRAIDVVLLVALLAGDGWRAVFLDYLHLGMTNATAFSPTDVMPLTPRAKYTMLVQSAVALALFGLVVARAVNAFA
jgi:hypothetical protein